MVGTDEITVRAGDHVVQFYERDSDLARSVARYVTGAVRAGEAAVMIASEKHHRAFAAQLTAEGLDLAQALEDRTVVRLDAATALASFRFAGRIDAEAFRRVIGSVIRVAGAGRRGVRAYGEMVALLWDADDVAGAIELERHWNDLIAEHQCSLLCAYRSSSVNTRGNAGAVRQVCRLHSSVLGSPGCEPAPTVGDRRSAAVERCAHFAAHPDAPGQARRFVTDVLRGCGHAGLVHSAQLVLSELATNAVVHARSPFSVAVRCTDRRVLISVTDASPLAPRTLYHGSHLAPGRGLRLVAALASDWGAESTAPGKTVWAELTAPPRPHKTMTADRSHASSRLRDVPGPRRAAAGARRSTVQVLDADPDLAAGIDRAQRKDAIRVAVAPAFVHPPGPWQFFPEPDPATLGALVLKGLIIVRVTAGTRAHVELLGSGDLISPWVGMGPDPSVPSSIIARVLTPARIALLDRGFAERTTRWPELHAALARRLIARARSVSLQAAVNALPRIDQRIELTLWQLADRFGQVTPEGITLNLPITHAHLAEMVAAQRPTVTAALSHLRQQERVIHTAPNHWLLRGPAPTRLSPLNETSRLRTQSATP